MTFSVLDPYSEKGIGQTSTKTTSAHLSHTQATRHTNLKSVSHDTMHSTNTRTRYATMQSSKTQYRKIPCKPIMIGHRYHTINCSQGHINWSCARYNAPVKSQMHSWKPIPPGHYCWSVLRTFASSLAIVFWAGLSSRPSASSTMTLGLVAAAAAALLWACRCRSPALTARNPSL